MHVCLSHARARLVRYERDGEGAIAEVHVRVAVRVDQSEVEAERDNARGVKPV